MKTVPAMLMFDIQSYWLHARGEGGGADFDLVMERGRDGLPVLRGRHVAGLLRLAIQRAVCWRWIPDEHARLDIMTLLMGAIGDGAPGCLDIRSAQITDEPRQALLADPDLLEACFQRLPTTAIDMESGVALEGQLRTVEAALPLPLAAQIRFVPFDRLAWAGSDVQEVSKIEIAANHWLEWIDLALPALDEVGAKRTRGFGRLAPCRLVRGTGDRA